MRQRDRALVTPRGQLEMKIEPVDPSVGDGEPACQPFEQLTQHHAQTLEIVDFPVECLAFLPEQRWGPGPKRIPITSEGGVVRTEARRPEPLGPSRSRPI